MCSTVDRRRVDERQAPTHPNDQPGHGRVGLITGPTADHVDQPTDLCAALVAHRPSHHAGQRHDGIPDGPLASSRWLRWRRHGRMVWWMYVPGAPRASGHGRACPLHRHRAYQGGRGGQHRPPVKESGHGTPRVSYRSTRGPAFESADHTASAAKQLSATRAGVAEGSDGSTTASSSMRRTKLVHNRSPPRSEVSQDEEGSVPATGGRGCSPGLLGGFSPFHGPHLPCRAPRARTTVDAPDRTSYPRPPSFGPTSCGHVGSGRHPQRE